MAERRRRRSTEYESEGENQEPRSGLSESTVDDSRFAEETEGSDDSEDYVTEEEETADEDDDHDDGSKNEGKRESGDGEEQPKLDDDEDQKNPAYIPRRGAFYEHDLRLDNNDKPETEDKQEDKRAKGKLWKDEEKWSHDRFDSYNQAPKSRQELVALYGYDITQDDRPPENPPKNFGGRRGRGGRDRKPQFQDFLPDDSGSRRGNPDRYNDDDDGYPAPVRISNSERSRGKGGRGRRGGGRGQRSYTDFKEGRSQRQRTYSSEDQQESQESYGNNRDSYQNRSFNNKRENYGNRGGNQDSYDNRGRNRGGNHENFDNRGRNRESYGNRGGNQESYGNQGRHRESYGNRGGNRDNFGNRGELRDNYGNRDNFGNRDNYRQKEYSNRDRANYANQDRYTDENYANQNYGGGNRNEMRVHEERSEFRSSGPNRGDERGRRGRGGFRNQRGGAIVDRNDSRESPVKQSGRGYSGRQEHSGDYQRQFSGGESRDRHAYERQHSGNKDRDLETANNEPQYKNKGSRRDGENQDRGVVSSEVPKHEAVERAMTRSYEKPSPKSYYTLSATDDDKLMDEDYPPGPAAIKDLNVTVTGDQRSFKDKDRQKGVRNARGPESSSAASQQYQAFSEDRREPPPSHGAGGKHQSSLPPRLQQQQQQQERSKRQKQQQQAPPSLQQQQQPLQQQQQQQQQHVGVEKQEGMQGRSNKRYSSQRQRPTPESPGFSEPQISQPVQQAPKQHIVSAPLQQQYQPNFSPTTAAGQGAILVRPAISPQRNAPPQLGVQSPAVVIPRGPPPQTILPVPGGVHPPPARGPLGQGPAAGPTPPNMRQPPPGPSGPVFAQVPHTLPTTAILGSPAQLISPPGLAPGAMIYAGPPPPSFQVPVPQFSAAPPLQTQTPGEAVHGGTTYYSQASAGGSSGKSGTTYYSPEMQLAKQSRVQVRRPKVPLPIVNPEDIKKGEGSSDSPQLEEGDSEHKDTMTDAPDISGDGEDESPYPSYEETMEAHTGHVSQEMTENVIKQNVEQSANKGDSETTQYENKTEDLDTNTELVNTEKTIDSSTFENNASENDQNHADDHIEVQKDIGNSDLTDSKFDDSNSGNVSENQTTETRDVNEKLSNAANDDVKTEVETSLDKARDDDVEVKSSTPTTGTSFVVQTEALTPTLSVTTRVSPLKEEAGNGPRDVVKSEEETPSRSTEAQPDSELGNFDESNLRNESEGGGNNNETIDDDDDDDEFVDSTEKPANN